MSEWGKPFTFQELIDQGVLEIGDGYRAKNSELGGSGPIFMRAGRLTTNGWDWDGIERFHASLESKVSNKKSRPGDTVVTTKGNSLGRTGYVSEEIPEFVYSPHLSYWRSKNTNVIDSRFLHYWALSEEFTEQLKSLAYGTDMAPYLSLSDQRRLSISLPSITDQRAIGAVLGALDDKIAINERIAARTDDLMRASYQGMGNFAAEAIHIGDLGQLVRDSISAFSLTGTENYIGLEHIPRRNMWLSAWDNSAKLASTKSAFRTHDILFGKLRPYFHKVGIALTSGVCSTDILVVRPKQPEYLGWLLLALSSDEVVAHASAVGEGTRMPRTRWKDLESFEVPWPGVDEATRIDCIVRAVVQRVQAAVEESRVLAALRDTLLPQLMSGRLRVRDAEKIVEDAT